MVFFVGLVTEEALEAVMPGGALRRWRRTLLPIVAAAGSVLGATSIYILYLRERSEFMLLDGWPVAAAQDDALAYFIAKAIFLNRRGPAIVSDAIAIAAIAFWHPTNPDTLPVAVGLMATAIFVAAGPARGPRPSSTGRPASWPQSRWGWRRASAYLSASTGGSCWSNRERSHATAATEVHSKLTR
jgi:hypothetical protein